jgi:hypothetical protein
VETEDGEEDGKDSGTLIIYQDSTPSTQTNEYTQFVDQYKQLNENYDIQNKQVTINLRVPLTNSNAV